MIHIYIARINRIITCGPAAALVLLRPWEGDIVLPLLPPSGVETSRSRSSIVYDEDGWEEEYPLPILND